MVTVYIDGIDKSGKSTLVAYIRSLSSFNVIPVDRGPITGCIMSGKSIEQSKEIFKKYSNQICVFLDVEPEDWKIRCAHSNERMIPPQVYSGDWDTYSNVAQENGMIVWRYDTSRLTPYKIAKDIIEKTRGM